MSHPATRRARAARFAPALAAMLAVTACACGSGYAVDRVLVADTDASVQLAAAGMSRDDVRAAASRIFESAPGFGRGGLLARRRHVVAQVVVQRAELFEGAGAPAVAEVALAIELSSRDGPAVRETARALERVSRESGPRAALQGAADRALRSAARGFTLQLAAEGKRLGALRADLRSPDPEVRERAVRVLAERGAREAVPDLVERLRDQDPEVVERAVGALAQLGDPRAVPALIDLSRRREPSFVAQMARVVGDLGGSDAEAWLGTLEAGHPEARVRTAARLALADIRARGGAGSRAR